MAASPTLLLVHGSWHGPWCWAGVEAALARRGVPTRTVQLPSVGDDPATLGGLAGDCETVAVAAAAIGGDVVVVGHSYGGLAITGARYGTNVRRLIYLCAFMPEEGRSLVSYLPPGPLPPFVDAREDHQDVVREVAAQFFYPDCPEAVAAAAIAQLRPQSAAAITEGAPRCAWKELPSTYICLTEDRIIPIEAQRMFAAQASATIDMVGSHSPMLSKPDELAGVLAGIAVTAAPAAA
jgi:pimeloyl-ACP methyl ester carboxylesterase